MLSGSIACAIQWPPVKDGCQVMDVSMRCSVCVFDVLLGNCNILQIFFIAGNSMACMIQDMDT